MEIERAYKFLTEIEIGFNVAESLPGLCIVSDILRVSAAKVEILVGIFFATTGFAGILLANKSEIWRWKKMSDVGLELMTQGVLNVLRGVGGLLLGISTYGIGNLALLAIQLKSSNGFQPIVKYGITSEPAFIV